MSEESKYYIPDKEDLSIGYECEIYYQTDRKLAVTENLKWHTVILDLNLFQMAVSPSFFKNNKVRTKYLTKEDIFNEGYYKVVTQVSNETWFRMYDGKIDIQLEYYFDTHKLIIFDDEEMEQGCGKHQLFEGECKSINEFRKIQKYLGIK